MNLAFDRSIVEGYRSNTQIARVLTESWMAGNMFCPRCGHQRIEHYANNRPVADFYCPRCRNEYELKSSRNSIAKKISDGAYETMIERITSNTAPDFFFMRYDSESFRVRDLLLIPKYFLVPAIIEKRPPLRESARRAGWIGCNIQVAGIPEQGRVQIITNGVVETPEEVVKKVARGRLLETTNILKRGWLMDVLNCINQLPGAVFSLQDVYSFEPLLELRHPENNHIQPKIRQQLQVLRDKGFLEFLGNGKYRKL